MNEQITIFDELYPTFKIKNKVRLIELFAGIGSQAKALERLGVDFEHYRVCEFDKYAIKSYNAIHGTNFETSDIKSLKGIDLGIENMTDFTYLLTYSFPCQDLSVAGKQKGMKKGDNTRSGLLWEVERLLDECKSLGKLPQILLMENVPQVIGTNNIDDFKQWQLKLETLCYSNYVSLLNSKDYGIPQNRNRCFMVSILGKHNYTFPKHSKLKRKLKDVLDKNVDYKYYLSETMINGMLKTTFNSYNLKNRLLDKENVCKTILARYDGCPQVINETEYDYECFDYRYDEGIRTKKYKDICQKITTKNQKGSISGVNLILQKGNNDIERIGKYNKIRKLTPLECFRLMGFDDEDYYKASEVNSDTQLYKQCGNSIVVDVLYYIFKQFYD